MKHRVCTTVKSCIIKPTLWYISVWIC